CSGGDAGLWGFSVHYGDLVSAGALIFRFRTGTTAERVSRPWFEHSRCGRSGDVALSDLGFGVEGSAEDCRRRRLAVAGEIPASDRRRNVRVATGANWSRAVEPN